MNLTIQSESKGFHFRSWFGGFQTPLDLIRNWEGEEKGNESNTMNEEDEGKKEEIFLLTPLTK